MKKLSLLLSVSILFVVACKSSYIKPKEICVVSDSYELGCSDERKSPSEYVRDLHAKDICTNPTDFFNGQDEVVAMAKIITKLKADLKRCRARR